MSKYPSFSPIKDVLPMGILITDRNGIGIYSNAAYQKLCGRSGDELSGSHWTMVVHSQDRDAAAVHWDAAVMMKNAFLFEARLELQNGETVWTRHNAAPVSDHFSDDGYIHVIEDISCYKVQEQARLVAEEQLFEEKERAQTTLNSIGDAVLSINIDGQVTYMNPVSETLTGFNCDEAVGLSLNEVFYVVDAHSLELTTNPTRKAIESDSIVTLDANTLLIAKSGDTLAIEGSAAPIHDFDAAITGAIIVFRGVRLSHETTSRMARFAQHDALTGLYNRHAFCERFEQSLALAQQHKTKMGLLFINLDKFKQMNDALGHDGGDTILITLANRLRSCVRSTDMVCRYGGDEFVVLLSEIETPMQAFDVAKKIGEAAAATIKIGEKNIALQLSIGVSVYPENGNTPKALLKIADLAMYRIKTAKRRTSDEKSPVAISENQNNWPKEWIRRTTDVRFPS
ncbi:MAG: diguanylate cyclase [Marinobacter sp.]